MHLSDNTDLACMRSRFKPRCTGSQVGVESKKVGRKEGREAGRRWQTGI